MSNIQTQIQDAESSAIKELEIATQYLAEKFEQAGRKARDILSSAKNDADSAFLAKKEILEKKLETSQVEDSENLEKNFNSLLLRKAELTNKGVSFLLTRISK